MTDHIRRHVRRYMSAQQVSQSALERMAGIADGILVRIMRGHSQMSSKTFNKLAPLVNWTPECEVECRENNERLQRIRQAGRNGAEAARVPWPVTRDHAKAGRHLYATVRML
jgi:hypothetical protein